MSLALAACRGSGDEGNARPPVKVETQRIERQSLRQTRDFIGTLNSRRAVLLQSQVTGYIAQIPVKAGDTVTQGQSLINIDSSRERAALSNLQALQSSRAANLEYTKQQAERANDLGNSGVVSRQAVEQATAAALTAQADAQAVQAQVEAQRAQLQYYRVSAPTAGKVSDIPVKVGDFVTPGTRLTTVVQDDALELNVQIPIELATRVGEGAIIEVLDTEGELTVQSPVTFVSPNVDPDSQLVLLKSVFENKGRLRFAQYVKTRLVLGAKEGIAVPVTAIQRVAGATFAFVTGDRDGKRVAKQKEVTLGDITSNHYEVVKGLQAGETLITTGVEKLYDNAPIAITAPAQTETEKKAQN
jgi:RND family efflux transporter MFP subunit